VNPVIVIVAAIVLLALASSARAAMAAPGAPTAAIGRFAQAIAAAEGYGTPGAIPTRANNPGDLFLGGTTIGSGVTVFNSAADGWSALFNELVKIRDGRSGNYQVTMTIEDMGLEWSGGDPNWAVNVARFLGVPGSTMIGTLL
jgi:hypothetical protein